MQPNGDRVACVCVWWHGPDTRVEVCQAFVRIMKYNNSPQCAGLGRVEDQQEEEEDAELPSSGRFAKCSSLISGAPTNGWTFLCRCVIFRYASTLFYVVCSFFGLQCFVSG